MNVLILSGSFGMGHNSASKAIKQAILDNCPNSNVYKQDILELIAPKTYKAIYSGFNFLVKHCKGYYNIYHKLSANYDFNGNFILENHVLNRVSKLVNRIKPDIIISTLPLCTIVASLYKRRVNNSIPLITCITDISKHNEWFNSYCDYYFVPTREIKNNLILKGFHPSNILITGIPVKREFLEKKAPKNKSKSLLIMGGGLGLIPKANDLYQRFNHNKSIQTTVILGNNNELYESLRKRYKNLNIIGYTNEVAKHMQNADLLLTKPGGVSMFEAIHSELPIICLKPYLNQEKHNAEYIENKGLGRVLWNSKTCLADEVINTINSEIELAHYKKNLKRVKNEFDIKRINYLISDLQYNTGYVTAID